MKNVRTLAALAVVAVPVCLTSASAAWWWSEKINTVKAYDACVKENASPTVTVAVIMGKCTEKHAAPVPVGKIKWEYIANPQELGQNLFLVNRRFRFKAENYVLTSVTATIIVDGKEATITERMDHPGNYLDMGLQEVFVGQKTTRDANNVEYHEWPEGLEGKLKAVMAAAGLEVTID